MTRLNSRLNRLDEHDMRKFDAEAPDSFRIWTVEDVARWLRQFPTVELPGWEQDDEQGFQDDFLPVEAAAALRAAGVPDIARLPIADAVAGPSDVARDLARLHLAQQTSDADCRSPWS